VISRSCLDTLDSLLVSEIARSADSTPVLDPQSAGDTSTSSIAYDVAAIAALAAAIFFSHLGSYGLWEPDEARYAEIAREMLQSGSAIVPHLNYVAYVEKPPLLYWLTTLSFWIFGISEFSARLPVALSAIAGVLATYWFALRAFGRRHAILAGAILATTPLYAIMAQVLTTDMLLTALVTIATFSFYLAWKEDGRWCWIAYVAMGLAVMTKGPVGAGIPILTMLIFLGSNRELSGAIARFRAVPGLALTLIISAPWFVAMTIREPGFFDFYFIGEHLRRAFVTDYSHSEAFYFYVPVLAVGLLPWSMLVPFLTWRSTPRNPARRFCVVAASVTIVAFSCASAKLIPYVLPAVAPLAVLIADGLVSCAWPETVAGARLRTPDSRILIESGLLLALMGAAVMIAAIESPQFRTPYVQAARPAMYAIAAILLAGGIVTTLMFMTQRTASGLGAIVVTLAFALIAGSWVRLEAEPLRSYAYLSRAIAEKAPDATIICYHRYVQSLPFYNRRRVILVGGRTELDFGARLDPDAREWFLSNDEQMFRVWEQPGRKVIVLDAGDLARLKERLDEFDIIAIEGKKRAIIRHERISSIGSVSIDAEKTSGTGVPARGLMREPLGSRHSPSCDCSPSLEGRG
jgi:4-amino-4-deoxy-L-arabinose transferase-like glycosyltransferase